MIEQLPDWIVADGLPAFYETEGATAIQMVAKLYNKVKELITAYNTFTTDINETIDLFMTEQTHNYEDFTRDVNNIVDNFINEVNRLIGLQDEDIANFKNQVNALLESQDTDIQNFKDLVNNQITIQDGKIDNAVSYMETNLQTTVATLFYNALLNNELTTNTLLNYNSETERLDIVQSLEMAEDGEY